MLKNAEQDLTHLVTNGDKVTIHIYGDSFGAAHHNDETWPVVLSNLKKEKIRVLCKSGTGPNYSLKKLLSDLEYEKIKNFDTIVFLLSDQKRLEFPFLQNSQHAGGVFRLLDDSWQHPYQPGPGVTDETLNIMSDQSYLNDFKHEIKVVAQTLGPMFLYENVKNITFLHLISQQFKKIRFVVFTCFSLEHYLSYYKDFNISLVKIFESLKFECLDTDNFDYVKIPIGHMVGVNENAEPILHNHMTVEQNKKFGQFVYDIIMFNEIDKSWFVKTQPYDDIVENDRPIESLFIYE